MIGVPPFSVGSRRLRAEHGLWLEEGSTSNHLFVCHPFVCNNNSMAKPLSHLRRFERLEPRLVLTVIINEIDSDTFSVDTAEFIELYDGGAGDTDLSGLVVVLYNGGDDASYRAFDLDGFQTDANGFFVLGNLAVPNVDLVFGNTVLQNGPDAVAVYQGDAASFPNDTPIVTDDLIDAVVYGTSDADDAGLAVLLEAGETQLDEDENDGKDAVSLQRMPDGASSFVTTLPTPGAMNVIPTVPIHEVQGAGTSSPIDGARVTVEGVVVGDYQGADALDGFFLQDAVGDGLAETSKASAP